MDDTTAADREWFERHPLATERYRPIVPGEWWPWRYPDDARVLVRKLSPDVRARQVLAPQIGTYDADEAAVIGEHIAEIPPWLIEELRGK